ncbi:hypothetical protein VEE76_23990 [Escherichia coli]|nr:hypothetical protein VEE76_23990 [Escherichia coli]
MKAVIPLLPVLGKGGIEHDITLRKSPLSAKLSAVMVGNIIRVTLTVNNPSHYPWAYPLEGTFVSEQLLSLTAGKDENFNYFDGYPQKPPNEQGNSEGVRPDDDMYDWLQPGHYFTRVIDIPARDIWQSGMSKDRFISLGGFTLPPWIEDEFNTVVLASNDIRVRCTGYDRINERYHCDVENMSKSIFDDNH